MWSDSRVRVDGHRRRRDGASCRCSHIRDLGLRHSPWTDPEARPTRGCTEGVVDQGSAAKLCTCLPGERDTSSLGSFWIIVGAVAISDALYVFLVTEILGMGPFSYGVLISCWASTYLAGTCFAGGAAEARPAESAFLEEPQWEPRSSSWGRLCRWPRISAGSSSQSHSQLEALETQCGMLQCAQSCTLL